MQKVQAKGWEKRRGKRNECRSVGLIASIFLIESPKVQREFKCCTHPVMILFITMKFTVFMKTFPPSTSFSVMETGEVL